MLKNPSQGYKQQGDEPSKAARAARGIGHACAWLWHKSKAVSVALALVIVVVLVGSVDALANMNRIYQGVSVGDIDLSGKTVDEATALIAQEYEPRVSGNTIVFCANEQVASDAQAHSEERDTLEEQISYEESLASRDRWTVNAQHIGATFDSAMYAEMAYQVGRNDGWLFGRLQAQASGIDIEPECTFNATSFDELRNEIIAALGTKMVNFDVEMKDGRASVTQGHDGYEVPQEWLTDHLNEGFLDKEGESRFIVSMEDVPVQIDEAAAQHTASLIDASLPTGALFQYDDAQWFADAATLADWTYTEVQEDGNGYALTPLFDETKANKAIIAGFDFTFTGSNYTVQFTNDDGTIMVNTNATGTVPQVRLAISELNRTFFTEHGRSAAPTTDITSAEIPDRMTFDEARDYGLVVQISSFTTQYASGASARNNNIHVAADALDDSICKAGESWSFLALSGETTADKGYQDAGAIVSGEYSDAIGGGICQVATTVFNAVYEAGYPIEKRYNHSLYIASYPEGRDAAIAYPDMDLIWSNDTDSDVLLVMSYTNSSVTATLYGTDPGYEVTTTYGEWQAGEPFKTVIRQDSDWPVGKEFVETQGTDGRSITIVRTVKDRYGNIIREKEFNSNYRPNNKVIVQGSAQ
ncbi:VanW family protein [Anaerotardibacter muris]|uniref:VanW family protein n=1 Tax=Anaerotardibacter muris TaxID=2941505 RepID=UPI00203B8109|nr:VanW family protein [Anaerotardibacter muris]